MKRWDLFEEVGSIESQGKACMASLAIDRE